MNGNFLSQEYYADDENKGFKNLNSSLDES